MKMLAIVPADDSPTCGVAVEYASVTTCVVYGRALLLRWKHNGLKHYGIGIGYGVSAGDMLTVRVPEEEQRIYDHLRSRLPMMDAKARIPRTDLRRAAPLMTPAASADQDRGLSRCGGTSDLLRQSLPGA